MSSKSRQPQKGEGLEQLLTCPVCLEIYKDPIILPCHHTLCKRCLDCLKKANNYFMCPCCKGLADAKKIKRDFRMRSLLELHMIDTVGAAKSTSMTTSCEICHKHAIDWKCVECSQYICHDCKVNHQSIFVCKNHTLETLESCAAAKKSILEEASMKLHDLEQECIAKKSIILSKAEKLHDQRSATLKGIVESKNEIVRKTKEYHTSLCQRAVHILAQEECNLNTLSSMIDSAIDGIRHKKSVLDNLIMSNDNASLLKCADGLCNKVMKVDISDLVITEMQTDLNMKLHCDGIDFSEYVKLSVRKADMKNGKLRSKSSPAEARGPESREAKTPTRYDTTRTDAAVGTGQIHSRRSSSPSPTRHNQGHVSRRMTRTPSPERSRTKSARLSSALRSKSPVSRHTTPNRSAKSSPRDDYIYGTAHRESSKEIRHDPESCGSISRIPVSTNRNSRSSIKGIIKESANKGILKTPTPKFLPDPSSVLSSSTRLKIKPSLEVKVNPQLLRTFTLIENNIWVVYLDFIEIYNQDGKLINKIKHHNMVDARAVTKTRMGHVVVACGSSCGILQFESTSKMDTVIGKSNGSFCDIASDQTYLYGLDYREAKVLIFKYLYNKWMPVRRISLAYWNGSARDTMLVHDENVFVCSYTNAEIYQYDQYGILLGEFNQTSGTVSSHITMPSLCYIDAEMEAVVVADTTRHTLHTVSYRGRVGDMQLPSRINTPHRVVQDHEGNLFVLEYVAQRIIKLSAV